MVQAAPPQENTASTTTTTTTTITITTAAKPTPVEETSSTNRAIGSATEEQLMQLNRMALELLGLVESRRDKCFELLQSMAQMQDNSSNCSTSSASVTSSPATTPTSATSVSSASSTSSSSSGTRMATPQERTPSMTSAQMPPSTNRNGSAVPPHQTAPTSATAVMRPPQVSSTTSIRGRISVLPPNQGARSPCRCPACARANRSPKQYKGPSPASPSIPPCKVFSPTWSTGGRDRSELALPASSVRSFDLNTVD